MDGDTHVLPTEVRHEIDTVAGDDDSDDAMSTVTTIAETSRAVRTRAQMRIYEEISLDLTCRNKDYVADLARIHATDPTVLAEYPRKLVLSDDQNAGLEEVPIIETIISQMRNLRDVSLNDLNVVGRPFTNSFAFKAQITVLELNHVTMSFSAFNAFISSPCLARLSLYGLDVEEYGGPGVEYGTDFSAPDCRLPQPQSALKCPLKELRLNLYTTSDLAIMDLIATSRHPIIAEDSLVKVAFSSMYSEDDHVPLFQRFLDCKAIKSTKTLHLGDHKLGYFTDQDSTNYTPLRLNTFETIELRVGIPREWGVYPPEFQWWANSLSAVHAGSALKNLRLIINLLDVNDTPLPNVDMAVWDALDDALCGNNLDLDYLVIDIATSVQVRRRKEGDVKRWLFDCLPNTYKKYFDRGKRWRHGSLNISGSFNI